MSDAQKPAEAAAKPAITMEFTQTIRSKNMAIDAALGPEHESDPNDPNALAAPGRRKSVASQGSKGSKKSFAESVMTVLSTSGRIIKKGVHKVGKALEEGISASWVFDRSRCTRAEAARGRTGRGVPWKGRPRVAKPVAGDEVPFRPCSSPAHSRSRRITSVPWEKNFQRGSRFLPRLTFPSRAHFSKSAADKSLQVQVPR